jgi:NADH-quinone oxidoreductase subunit H
MDAIDWLIVIVRVVVVFAALLITVVLTVWMERKVAADMQTRIGPNRAGPWGILISIADGTKLMFKEGITPLDADKPVYWIAPIIALVPAVLGFAIIPFGPGITISGHEVPFQIADLSVGVLWVMAMSSLAVYGVVLAGWSSGSRYPLLGSIRSTAQMISYEVGMGLALVAVLMYAGTLSMSAIVEGQAGFLHPTVAGITLPIPKWNIIPQFPAFLIYVIAALAETNRPPFDLAEAESELVAGFHTEYSGMKFAIFFLAEYLHTVTVASITVTLFLGGWNGPHIGVLPGIWPLVWFMLKLVAILYFYMWIRSTLPRFRYDRLMAFGWKVLIPTGLVWVLATGAIIVLPQEVGKKPLMTGLVVVFGVLLLAMLVWPTKKDRSEVAA